MQRLLLSTAICVLSILGLAQFHDFQQKLSAAEAAPATAMMQPLLVSGNCDRSSGYFDNFDTSLTYELPHCWDYFSSSFSPFFTPVKLVSYPPSPISASNSLQIYSNGTDTVFAISPRFTDLAAANKMIDFFAWTDNPGEELIIGLVDSSVAPFNFSALDTLILGSTPLEYIVEITPSNYNGSGQYLAMMHGRQQPYSNIYVDDFLYDTLPACPKAINPVVSFVGDTAAIISINGSASNYNFYWGPPGFLQATASFGSGASPYTIHPLNPDAPYEFIVASNCQAQGNGISPYGRRYQFNTICSPITASYSNNFDQELDGDVPTCWTNVLQGNGNNSVNVHFQQINTAFSTPHLLRMYKSGNTNSGDLTMTCPPAFSDLDQDEFQLRFLASSVKGSNALLIGTVSSAADPASFVLQDSIYLPSSSASPSSPVFSEYVVALDTALIPAGHQQVALIASNNTDPFSSLYIDNFHYEPATNCLPPSLTSINLLMVDSSSAELHWNAGQGLKTKVIYGQQGFLSAGGAYDSVYTTADSIVLSGLSSDTPYELYLVDSCAGGSSYWAGPFNFITQCGELMAPYYENFDGSDWAPGQGYSNGGDAIDNCWFRDPPNAYNYHWSVGNSSTPSGYTGPQGDVSGSGNFLFIHSSLGSQGDTAILRSPLVDVSGLSQPYLEFYFHRYGSNMSDLFVEYLDGTQWQPLLQIQVQPQLAHTSPYSKIGALIPNTSGVTQIRWWVESSGFGGSDIAIDEVSIAEAPSCVMPTDLMLSNLSDTAATFTWNGNAANYQLWLGQGNFYQGPQSSGGQKLMVGTDSVTLDTLTPNTSYQLLLRGVCGAGDSSDYSFVINFQTQCSQYNAPYFTDFDSDTDGESPSCWEVVERGPSAEVKVYATQQAYSEPNCLYMNNGNLSNVLMAVTPSFSDLSSGSRRIRMRIKRSANAPEVLYIGTATYPFSDSTFHPIDTLLPGVTYSSYIQEFTTAEGYNGSDLNIAFMHGNTGPGGFNFREIFIDDFHYEAIPACKEVDNFAVDSVAGSDSTALLSWTANSSSSYLIEFGPAGFNPGQGSTVSTSNDSILINLPPLNVPYDFYIYSVCGPDTGYALGPLQHYGPSSLCEDFEAYTTGLIKEQSSLFQPDPMGFMQDASEISNAQSYSGSQSLHMVPPMFFGYSSAIADFDDIDSGSYSVSLAIYVESYGQGGYTLYRDFDPDPFMSNEYGMGVAFHNNGQGHVLGQISANDTVANFSFNTGQWHYMQHIVDLDQDTTWMLIDGVDINAGWQYTRGISASPSRLDGLRFSAFKFNLSGFDDDYYIDDFCIRPYQNCFTTAISSISATACDEVEITLADTVSSIIEYGPAGFSPGSGSQLNSSASPMLVGGLQAGTTYQFYNYSLCANGDTSAVMGPYSVTTDSLPVPALQISSSSTYAGNAKTIALDGSNSVNVDYIVWDYGNGVIDTGFSSSHSYTSNGMVSVLVTAYNACGSVSDTLSFNIDISADEYSLSRLSVYPNPMQDELSIELDQPGSAFVNIRLVDARGRVVHEESLRNLGARLEYRLSMAGQAPGMYMLVVETAQQSWVEQLQKL